MLRTAPRTVLRQSTLPVRAQRLGVRYQSTAPIKRRSFKNTLVRWGIAVGGIYWYNTSPLFNEPPAYTIQNTDSDQDETLPTIASVAASSRFRPPHASEAPVVPSTPTANSPPSINPKSPDPRDPNAPTTVSISGEQATQSTDPESLHQEAAQQGAFNEETGEINWDCPCLGGMAHGPCGQEFRDAFSCFVYSDKEPKGIDCIENFENMQTCFRAHPEIYASEIEDDENTQRELEAEAAGAPTKGSKDTPDVDEPSVWTPISDAEDSGNAAPVKPAVDPSLRGPPEANSSPAPTNAPSAKPRTKSEKESVYDAPAAEQSPASSPSSLTHKVSGTEPKAPASSRDKAFAEGKKVKDTFGSDQSRDEAQQVIPKAAHDAR